MAITEHAPLPLSASEGRRRYLRPPQPIHFPASEEMPETNRHLELRTALYLILKRELAARATLGSDQFVYYDPTNARKKLAPDAFAKLGEPHATFRVWKTWLRGAPDVAVEVVSDSDEGEEDWELKLERYRAAGIGEVVRFDPDSAEQPIRVWDHIDGDLVERAAPPDGVFECSCLGLFWVAVPHQSFVRMLRLARDRAGADLLPTPEEAELTEAHARADAERARDQLAAEVAGLRRQLEAQSAGSARRGPPKARGARKAPGKARG
jgi:Uma2 family endonuclease